MKNTTHILNQARLNLLMIFPLVAALVVAPVISVRADERVHFDFTAGHPFAGVGANMWVSGKDPVGSDAVLDSMNARFVRVSLLPAAPVEQIQIGGSVAQISSVIKANDTENQKENFISFRDRMSALSIKPHQIFWGMPVEWMTVVEDRQAGHKKNSYYARTDRIPDYANLIVARLLYTTSLGIEPDGIELTNEPHGAWTSGYAPDQYALLVNTVRARLDENGLSHIKIDGPGTSLAAYSRFSTVLKSSGAQEHIDAVSSHVYLSPEDLADPKTPGVAQFLGKGQDGPIIISEFGVKGVEGEQKVEGSENDPASMPYALKEAATGLMLLGMGAQSIFVWELETSVWTYEDHGLISLERVVRPTARSLEALFGRIQAGADVTTTVVATGSTISPASLTLQGFHINRGDRLGRIIVAAVNRTGEDQKITVSFSGNLKKPTTVSRMVTYNGTGDIVRQRKGFSIDGNGVLTVTVPAKSVASIRVE